MQSTRESVFDKPFKPLYQALLVLGIYFIILVFIQCCKLFGWLKSEPMDYWKYGTSMILFFIILNGVFCFSTKDKISYYRNSVITYVLLLLFLALTSQWLSGTSIFEAESYSWIITVFSIIFIVMLTIINAVRKIVEIAIKQDNKLTDEK